MSAADDFHEELFGYRPDKPGTAYERLAAIVLASLGWHEVRHDTKLRPDRKRAEHQLDVTATNPDGSVRRLLVECKDWDKKVKKSTLDALVGIKGQLEFDAAMVVTTVGFTGGAVDVAVDEDVAMVVLRDFRPGDGPFVMGFELKVGIPAKDYEDFDFEIDRSSLANDGTLRFKVLGTDRLLHLDGSPAETVAEILEANGSKLADGEGEFQCSADLGPGRLVTAEDGTLVPITEIRWTERVRFDGITVSHQAEGSPELVVEQLDEDGESDSSRLVVDRHLNAWDIDAAGNVVPRGQLPGPST